ncbi:hypothetical protein [Paraburkholderia sp. SIMBA_054]|uniref:hypothetical protein n=1 Tax=Paraburkholderia sp. SIMBA_054 TaxID=3085795 RepID=UPI003979E7AA
MNSTISGFVVGAKFSLSDFKPSVESIPCDGKVVWSELMHPVYEQVVEIRLMPNRRLALWHHYGEPTMAWQDEVAPEFLSLETAIAQVRLYQHQQFGTRRFSGVVAAHAA